MPKHHPAEEILLCLAAGNLAEPLELIVATHLSFCAECRSRVAAFEVLGGALLAAIPPHAVSADAFDRLLARLDDAAAGDATVGTAGHGSFPAGRHLPEDGGRIPAPLRRYAGQRLADLSWERRSAYLRVMPLLRDRQDYRTRIVRIDAGQAIPIHTHPGHAYSLVLKGSYSAADGHYGVGDFGSVTPHFRHSPTADPDSDCICLGVAEQAPRFVGPLGPLRNLTLRV